MIQNLKDFRFILACKAYEQLGYLSFWLQGKINLWSGTRCRCCGRSHESVTFWPSKMHNGVRGIDLCGECAYGGDCPKGLCT